MLTTPGRRVEQHAVDNLLQLYGQTLRQEDIDRLQVQLHGFSLPANTSSLAHRRDPLERLIRYTARGAISRERLAPDEGGDLLYTISRHLIRLQETAHHLPTLKYRSYADGLLPTRNQASQPQHISFYCKLLRSTRSTFLLVTIA